MPPETPPAHIRPADLDLMGCLLEARRLMARSEREALECGRLLRRAKELCVRAGRGWLEELARTNFPRSSAWRYMHAAEEADRPPDDSPMSQPHHAGPIASETPAEPERESHPEDDATPVRRRPRADAATDDPRELSRREALTCLDGLKRTLPSLDLLDRHAAELHRLRCDLDRAARPG